MRREYTFLCLVSLSISSSAEGLHPDSYELPFYAGIAVCFILIFLLLFFYTHLRRTGRQLSNLTQDYASLKLKYAESSQSQEQLNKLHEQQTESHIQLEQTCQQLERELNQLQQEYTRLQADCSQLHEIEQAYHQLQTDHAILQTTHKQQNDKLEQCSKELEKKEDRIQQLFQVEDKLRAEIMHLQQQLDAQQQSDKDHPNQRPLTLPDGTSADTTDKEKNLTPLPSEDMQWNSKEEFLSQIIRFMRDNMDNSNLNIEVFAKQMNISRSMLCRKIKAVTGLTPVEFMHRVRITYAIELLKSDYTFSQIAYMAGFNDPKYFTKCFKRYTGLTPSEYKEKRLQKNHKGNKEIFSHNNSYQFANYLGEDLYS